MLWLFFHSSVIFNMIFLCKFSPKAAWSERIGTTRPFLSPCWRARQGNKKCSGSSARSWIPWLLQRISEVRLNGIKETEKLKNVLIQLLGTRTFELKEICPWGVAANICHTSGNGKWWIPPEGNASLNATGTSPSAQGALTVPTEGGWLHKNKHFSVLK